MVDCASLGTTCAPSVSCRYCGRSCSCTASAELWGPSSNWVVYSLRPNRKDPLEAAKQGHLEDMRLDVSRHLRQKHKPMPRLQVRARPRVWQPCRG